MRWEQYSTIIQLATALSLAGWVARTPESQLDPYTFRSQYNGYQNTRSHPYSNLNNDFYDNDVNHFGGAASTLVQQQPENYQRGAVQNSLQNLYSSKEVESRYREFMELQDLVSWQESYRRGDFKLGYNQQHPVLPIVHNTDNLSPLSQLDQTFSTLNEDGYASTIASLSSPSPVFSDATSFTADDSSNSLPPLRDVLNHPNVYDHNLGNSQGALYSGYVPFLSENDEFDIDDILEFGQSSKSDSVLDENELAALDMARRPYENLKCIDNDLEYVNSPLKSPTLDEFLGSPMPGHIEPAGSLHDRSFEDPFSMQFTNSSGGNKGISNTLFDAGYLKHSTDILDDNDIDEILVASLSEKYAKSLLPMDCIKQEIDLPDSQVSDHDYPKQFHLSKDLQKYNLMKFNQGQPPQLPKAHSRTFAPQASSNIKVSKAKQQQKKSALVWADFHYTTDEIITMPVERFNEVIKQLDIVRQHVARDIRRKGKNKLAARSCRKRKMDVLDDLDQGVDALVQQKIALLEEHQRLLDETKQIRATTEWLNSYIFEHLRDANNKPYSSTEFSLQYTSDGHVYLVPSGKRNSQN